MSLEFEQEFNGTIQKNTDIKPAPTFCTCPKCEGTARKLFFQTKQTKHNPVKIAMCTPCNMVIILDPKIKVVKKK